MNTVEVKAVGPFLSGCSPPGGRRIPPRGVGGFTSTQILLHSYSPASRMATAFGAMTGVFYLSALLKRVLCMHNITLVVIYI